VISIVVPAYNEERRIVPFLEEMTEFVKNGKYEVLLVNDGSGDRTLDLLNSASRKSGKFRVISYEKNMGKGYAVRQGVTKARGDYVIFIDADGSIRPDEIRKMEPFLKKYDIVVGTRASAKSDVKQPKKRKFLGITFNLAVNLIYQTGISDSLCGFKGFRRDVAKDLFSSLLSNRWVFDVEIFHRARKRKYSLYQLPIVWEHRGESRIKTLDPLKMVFQLLVLRVKMAFNS